MQVFEVEGHKDFYYISISDQESPYQNTSTAKAVYYGHSKDQVIIILVDRWQPNAAENIAESSSGNFLQYFWNVSCHMSYFWATLSCHLPSVSGHSKQVYGSLFYAYR